MSENPFVYSKPVLGDRFYNRKEEIEMAVGSIRSLQSFSLIGERRIGKTSFLIHILSRDVLAKHNVDPEKYIAVYLDMRSLHKITESVFIKAIIEKIEEKAEIKVETADGYESLKTLVEELNSKDKNLIIALDEFELIAQILDEISFRLRYIFQKEKVVAITASRTTVGELSPEAAAASPLFNILDNVTLGLFSRKETKEMIEDVFCKGEQKLGEDEVSFLADLSGGNPYLIQRLGYDYYNKRIEKDEFEIKMLDKVKDVFEGHWKHLSEEEREFLFDVIFSKSDRIGYELKRKGFLVNEKKEWKIFSILFRKFLFIKKEKEKEKRIREEENGTKPVIRIRTADIFLAFMISIAASLVTPYVQEWLNLSSTFLEWLSSRIDPVSLIIFALVFTIVLFGLIKLHRRHDI